MIQKTNLEYMVSVRQTVCHLGISLRISCKNHITPTLKEGERRGGGERYRIFVTV